MYIYIELTIQVISMFVWKTLAIIVVSGMLTVDSTADSRGHNGRLSIIPRMKVIQVIWCHVYIYWVNNTSHIDVRLENISYNCYFRYVNRRFNCRFTRAQWSVVNNLFCLSENKTFRGTFHPNLALIMGNISLKNFHAKIRVDYQECQNWK